MRPRGDLARRQAGGRRHPGGARRTYRPLFGSRMPRSRSAHAACGAEGTPRCPAHRDCRVRFAGVPRCRRDTGGHPARGAPRHAGRRLPDAFPGSRRSVSFIDRCRRPVVSVVRVFRASAALEIAQVRANLAFVGLTALAAVSFLVMVSLFGLTGAYAPMALIDLDGGPYARSFVDALLGAHHSFRLRDMDATHAGAALNSGHLVGIITIPAGFSADVEHGATVAVDVRIDNVNVDLTHDVQRALPAAIVAFGRAHNFPGIRVQMLEHDVMPRDTGYIAYLVVSALALDALVIAGVLGAMATAREWERRTVKFLRLSPAPAGAVLAGKLAVAAAVAAGALAVSLLAIVFGYGIVPVAPWTTVLALAACVAIFTCIGAWLGALLKRTLAAVPLLFGLAMPFYVDSGALEPTRFDGESIWRIAHLSPVYYAVGVLEWAFHGLRVTPEPVYVNLLVLLTTAVVAVALTVGRLSKGAVR